MMKQRLRAAMSCSLVHAQGKSGALSASSRLQPAQAQYNFSAFEQHSKKRIAYFSPVLPANNRNAGATALLAFRQQQRQWSSKAHFALYTTGKAAANYPP